MLSFPRRVFWGCQLVAIVLVAGAGAGALGSAQRHFRILWLGGSTTRHVVFHGVYRSLSQPLREKYKTQEVESVFRRAEDMYINKEVLQELSEKEGWGFFQPPCDNVHGCPECKCHCNVGTLTPRLDWQDHTWTNNRTTFYGGSAPGDVSVEFEFSWKPQWDYENDAFKLRYCPRAHLYDAIVVAKGMHDAFFYDRQLSSSQLEQLSKNLECFKDTRTKIIIRTATKTTHNSKMPEEWKVNTLLANGRRLLIDHHQAGGFGNNGYLLDAYLYTVQNHKLKTYDGTHYHRSTGLQEWEFQKIMKIMAA